jgi:ABC-type multidrug transport system fused ATPase/permease subunit
VGEIFRRFWSYARPLRTWMVVSAVFVAVGPGVEAAQIGLFKRVVDDVLIPKHFGLLLPIMVVYVVLMLVSGVVSFVDDVLGTWLGERFVLSLRVDVFRHLHGLSLDFFERRRLGDLISRLSEDVSTVESFLVSGVSDAFSNVVTIAVFAGVLLYLQWQLALVSFLAAPLFWALARRFSRLIKQASREKRRRSGSISSVAEESLGNVALVQAYNAEAWEIDRFERESVGKFHAEMASTRLRALFRPLVDFVELIGALTVIGFATWHLARGHLTVGGLLVFLAFLTRLYSPIRGLSRLTNTVYSASASAERILDLLEQQPAVTDPPHSCELEAPEGVVEFVGVAFRYPGTDRDAVAGVSFRVSPGQTLALVGPSGAGKSTIAKLLLRFYDPTCGEVRFDGVDVRSIGLRSLRKNVAVLLQETLVIDGTVRENIAYGRTDLTDDDIVAAATAADADEFIRALPDGYDTRVGQRGRRLSGGQRQRLAIARAMARNAPVLILDEPMTGLDAGSGERILEPLRRLMDGRTTIVISHNLLTVREADEIVVLEGGRVVDRGRHGQLLARQGLYAELYRAHFPKASELDGHREGDGLDPRDRPVPAVQASWAGGAEA